MLLEKVDLLMAGGADEVLLVSLNFHNALSNSKVEGN